MDIREECEKDAAAQLPNYRLFWVDDKQVKHTVLKFKADNDEEALLKRDEHDLLNDDHVYQYYYGRIHYVKCLNKDGTFTIRDMDDISQMCGIESSESILGRVFDSICSFFTYWLWQKPIDMWYSLKDIAYLIKHGERRSNQWNLDMHLVDTIELNLPSLIENSHSMMFLDEAIMEMHANDPGFDLKKYHLEHCTGYSDEVEKRALKIQEHEYEKLLLDVKLYKYYLNGGVVNTNDREEAAFDRKYRHTLPVKPGTYDEFDNAELQRLVNEKWNAIWDWVKRYGHTLYD